MRVMNLMWFKMATMYSFLVIPWEGWMVLLLWAEFEWFRLCLLLWIQSVGGWLGTGWSRMIWHGLIWLSSTECLTPSRQTLVHSHGGGRVKKKGKKEWERESRYRQDLLIPSHETNIWWFLLHSISQRKSQGYPRINELKIDSTTWREELQSHIAKRWTCKQMENLGRFCNQSTT